MCVLKKRVGVVFCCAANFMKLSYTKKELHKRRQNVLLGECIGSQKFQSLMMLKFNHCTATTKFSLHKSMENKTPIELLKSESERKRREKKIVSGLLCAART